MFMVSNHRREADHHPPLFFIGTLLLLVYLVLQPGTCDGQKIKTYYVSSLQPKGTLYFIRPQQGFKNKSSGSSFVYDMTCLSSADSVTLNFSLFDKNSRVLDTLSLVGASKKISVPISKIFIETKKTAWHYRYTSRIALKELEQFFNERSGTIQLLDKSKVLTLTSSQKRWKKYAAINTKIFQLIRYNK